MIIGVLPIPAAILAKPELGTACAFSSRWVSPYAAVLVHVGSRRASQFARAATGVTSYAARAAVRAASSVGRRGDFCNCERGDHANCARCIDAHNRGADNANLSND
jgi:hypothetical protein